MNSSSPQRGRAPRGRVRTGAARRLVENDRPLGIEPARDRRLGDALDGEAVGGHPHRGRRASSHVAHVSSNARVTISFSRALTSSSFQKYSCRPCTHSKYETTTPPAFASTSGRTSTPFASRISSAAGVTGPFAPSTISFAFTRSAFASVIDLLERARREHVAVEQQQLLVRDRVAALELGERAAAALVRERSRDVDARWRCRRRPSSPRSRRPSRRARRRTSRRTSRRCRSPARRPADPSSGRLLLAQRRLEAEDARRARSPLRGRASRRSSTACR